MTKTLKQTSFKGLTWSFIDNLAGSGVSFITGIILARLLSPSDFGIVGMVTIILAFANTIIDSGFSVGLIRKVICSDAEYSTVFFFSVAMSIFIYCIIFLTAPYVAFFFNEDQLIQILRVLGLVIIIDSFSIIQKVLLIRNIDFKRQTIISISSSILSGIIGIYSAISGLGVWSLVYQIISRQIIILILFWVLTKWYPVFIFSLTIFKEMFSFGSKILLSGLVATLQNNIYYLFIGRYFSTTNLGYYTRAEQFNAIVTGNLTGTLERVFFPVLASIQEDEKRLKATLKKVTRTSFFVTYFALISLAVVAEPLIYILIGQKWETSIIYLQLICLSSIFLPLNAVNLNILKIKGRSDLILQLQIIKTLLIIPNIIVGIYWGITAMLLARILITFISFLLNSQYSGRLMNYSLQEQFFDIKPYLIILSLIAIIMYAFSFIEISNYLKIIGQILIGGTLFFFLFERFKFHEYLEIKFLILNYIKGKLLLGFLSTKN